MDAGLAAILGTIIGAIIGWLISLFTRRQDDKTHREEREYELLVAASRELRFSLLPAAGLDYSKSKRAIFDPTSWGIKWEPFLESVVRAGSVLALLSGQLPEPERRRLETAMQVLVDAKRSDQATLTEYFSAATDMRRLVDRRAAELAGLPPPAPLDEITPTTQSPS